jgi:hypothetical protein
MQLDPENTVKEFFREYPFERILGGLSRIHGVSVSFRATDEEKGQRRRQRSGARRQGQLPRSRRRRRHRQASSARAAAAAAGEPTA